MYTKAVKVLLIFAAVLLAILAVLAIEAYLAVRGPKEKFESPSRVAQQFGNTGPPLIYAVLGDSTAAGQGAAREAGIAQSTARHLGQAHTVSLTNLAVSGARAKDVAAQQLPAAVALKPNLVLISVGANDVTHLTRIGAVEKDLGTVFDELIKSNCNVKIVVTGSPDLGGAHRFAQPLRQVAGLRSAQLNRTILSLTRRRAVTFAPIAAETGPSFRRNPELLADDRFHPNEDGYRLWIDVLNPKLDEALRQQPSHCK